MRPKPSTKVVIKSSNILSKGYIHNEKDNTHRLRLNFHPQSGIELTVNLSISKIRKVGSLRYILLQVQSGIA